MNRRDTILLPADLVFYRSDSIVSRLIRRFTPRDGDEEVYATHVAGVTGLEHFDEHSTVLEATAKGVMYNLLDRPGAILVLRANNITPQQRAAIAITAQQFLGRNYGFHKLLAHLGDWYITSKLGRPRDVRLFRKLLFWDDRPICVWPWAKGYAEQGLTFGIEAESATPHDMCHYALSSGNYGIIGIQGEWGIILHDKVIQ